MLITFLFFGCFYPINHYICKRKINNTIMTNAKIIKEKGLKTKRIETGIYKGVFGGRCNHVIALVNDKDEVLHLEDTEGNVKPYFPCGRSLAYASLIKSGDIDSKYFSFKALPTLN